VKLSFDGRCGSTGVTVAVWGFTAEAYLEMHHRWQAELEGPKEKAVCC